MKTITPCLWLDREAEQAAAFYLSVFPDSRITAVTRYPDDADSLPDESPGRAGEVLTVEFEINGQPFTALNGGPQFTFSEAVSFQVICSDQDEVDDIWAQLISHGGEEGPCGWCSRDAGDVPDDQARSGRSAAGLRRRLTERPGG